MYRRNFLGAAVALAGSGLAASAQTLPTLDDQGQPRRYPDADIKAVDPRFKKLIVGNTAIERLWTGAMWSEGPVWFGDMRCLIWSDDVNNRLLRYDEDTDAVSVFRKPSNNANGNARDRQGRLVTCEHGLRRVTRTEHDGRITVLLDRFEGKPLNAPNDIVVKSDGTVWFTDPGYGIDSDYEGYKAPEELPRRVYRIDPVRGTASVATDVLKRPNGLCFSPDEKLLYICDTAIGDGPGNPSNIRVFQVGDDGKLSGGSVFHDFLKESQTGLADGIRADVEGNIWCGTGWQGAGFDGVQCLAPDGALIGKILLPEICANIAFGGEKLNRLFMAASTSLYAVYVNVRGVDLS